MGRGARCRGGDCTPALTQRLDKEFLVAAARRWEGSWAGTGGGPRRPGGLPAVDGRGEWAGPVAATPATRSGPPGQTAAR